MHKKVRKVRSSKSSRKVGKPVRKPDNTLYPMPTAEDLQGTAEHVVPISFGNLTEDVNAETVPVSVENFYNDYLAAETIDLSPPYQRDEAWSISKQAKFVQNLFKKSMPIPAFWLCNKNKRQDCIQTWALDCRQRCTSLRNFFRGEFPIIVQMKWESGAMTQRKVYWKEIESSDAMEGIRRNFLQRQLSLVTFQFLSLDSQKIVFEILNSGVPLNVDELTYCHNFLARRVLSYAFKEVFGVFDDAILTPKVRNKQRFVHIRAIHELLMLVNGVKFTREDGQKMTNEKDVIGLRKQERITSATEIHNRAKALDLDYGNSDSVESELPSNVMDDLKLTKKLATLKKLARLLAQLFATYPNLGRQISKKSAKVSSTVHPRNIIDALGYLYYQLENRRVSFTTLEANKSPLADMLGDYYKGKEDASQNQSTSDVGVLKAKFYSLDKHFEKFLRKVK